MANAFIKATKVVTTALGILERESILPRLVWMNPAGDFAGALSDTISIRVPAYVVARTRTLRGGTPITVDELNETKCDVTLDTDVYKGIKVTDENLTLDIVNFTDQVLNPILRSIVMGLEDAVAAAISGADYELTLPLVDADPYETAVKARAMLNLCNVPSQGRVLLVGSGIETKILTSARFTAMINGGNSEGMDAMHDAIIGRLAGFTVIQSNGIPTDKAYAFHKSAYVLSTRAPLVPDGASWGASQSFGGLALRVIKDYDPLNLVDRCIASTWCGTGVVTDKGTLSAAAGHVGQFIPDETGNAAAIMVRAVEITDGV